MSAAIQSAYAALRAGISVVPVRVDETKAPAVREWKPFQTERVAVDDVPSLFAGRAVGIIGGVISGNLEILDFESEAAFSEYVRRAQESGLGELLERVSAGYTVRTGGGGYHVAYRCAEPVAKSHKLARSRGGELLVETRGEGGYAVAPGSPAATHETGREYTFERGDFHTLATVTADEREDLLALARSLDEEERRPAHDPRATVARFSARGRLYDGESPGDAYSAQTTWDDVLVPHGWRRLHTDAAGVTYWRRPGKKRGVSATTGVHGGEYLYVFTTSTVFDAERGYSRFAAHAILDHGGDFNACARSLYERGFGGPASSSVADVVDLSMLLEQRKAPQEPGIPAHLYRVDGLVGDLARYLIDGARYPQPELALGASLAAVATILGRKVRSESGLRTNLYVLGVAPQGAGKEFARATIKDVYRRIDAFAHVAHDKLASDAAIWSALEEEPASLFLLDEIGRLFARLNARNAPAHIESQVDAYLTLYSQAGQVVVSKSYADATRRTEIVEPCLSIYGTTVPSNFYAALTGAEVTSGFLSRFLVFESTQYPDPVEPKTRDVPSKILGAFTRWHEQPLHGGNLEAAIRNAQPEPYTVPAYADAEAAFVDLELRMRARARSAVDRGEEPGVEVRVGENARKLALVVACGCDPVAPAIDASTARWACELAEHLADAFTAQLSKRAGDSERERQVKTLAAWLASRKTVTRSEITVRFQSWPRRDREEILADLIDSGRAAIEDVPATGRGRPAKMVRWLK